MNGHTRSPNRGLTRFNSPRASRRALISIPGDGGAFIACLGLTTPNYQAPVTMAAETGLVSRWITRCLRVIVTALAARGQHWVCQTRLHYHGNASLKMFSTYHGGAFIRKSTFIKDNTAYVCVQLMLSMVAPKIFTQKGYLFNMYSGWSFPKLILFLGVTIQGKSNGNDEGNTRIFIHFYFITNKYYERSIYCKLWT